MNRPAETDRRPSNKPHRLPLRSRSSAVLAATLATAVVATSAACERHATPESVTDVLPSATPPEHNAPSVDALREAHAEAAASEGISCRDDRDCASPLRCADATCLFPDAMTGNVGDATPYVEFAGSRLPSVRYYLEVADESWESTRGLMHRHSMVEDMGMVFDFGADSPRQFWMRNTYIPLDMVFVTDAGVVDSFVQNATPQTDTGRSSAGPARYVVELNAGEVARMGLEAGSPVRFEGVTSAEQ